MGNIFRKSLILILVLALNSQILVGISSARTKNPNSYTIYKTVNKDSFNEYRYLITKEFFKLKRRWGTSGVLSSNSLKKLKKLVHKSFFYLPSNDLRNENLLNNLNIAISKALKYRNSDAAYANLEKAT
jgi:hypothetical protein